MDDFDLEREIEEELRKDRERPSPEEIEEDRQRLLERQRRFVIAAECVARELSRLPVVTRVVLFGSVANPLAEEIPRFYRYRRWRIALPHECGDVDVAVWLTDFSDLRTIQKAKLHALEAMSGEHGFHLATHQLEIFLHSSETGAYVGRLCQYAKCPKGKRECTRPGCGNPPYLKDVEGFVMRSEALAPERSRVLFER